MSFCRIECLHYALNLPTSVVITGIDSMKVLDQAIEAARTFKPMTEERVASLLARAADSAREGKFEVFKTGTKFDSTSWRWENGLSQVQRGRVGAWVAKPFTLEEFNEALKVVFPNG